MKLIVFAVYAVFLFAGTAFIVFFRSPAGELIATRPMEKNHLLQAGDVALRVVGGQYVRRAVKAGATVRPTDLNPYPDVRPSIDRMPMAVKVEQEKVKDGTIEAGKSVLICPLAVAVKVDAVFCGAESEPCIAIAAVPAAGAGTTLRQPNPTLQSGPTCK